MIKRFFNSSIFRFLLVGVANTAFGTAVMILFYSGFHCSTELSTAANYFFGGILSFILNKRFTFKSTAENAGQYVLMVVKFALTVGVCWFAAYSVAKPLMLKLLPEANEAVRDYGIMLVCMILYTGLNYIGQRFFAFAKGGKK